MRCPLGCPEGKDRDGESGFLRAGVPAPAGKAPGGMVATGPESSQNDPGHLATTPPFQSLQGNSHPGRTKGVAPWNKGLGHPRMTAMMAGAY